MAALLGATILDACTTAQKHVSAISGTVQSTVENSSEVKRLASVAPELMRSTNNLVLPSILLVLSILMVMYRHITIGLPYMGLRDTQALLLVQMIPLLALKFKMYTCSDRMGLLCRFAIKVLLIHVAFLSLRVTAQLYLIIGGLGWKNFWSMMTWDLFNDITSLYALLKILKESFGWEWDREHLSKHIEIQTLVGVSVAAAFSTQIVDAFLQPKLYKGFLKVVLSSAFEASNYLDVLTFVPGIWMLYRQDDGDGTVVFRGLKAQDHTEDKSKQTMYFFMFLLSFYFTEDLLSPIMTLRKEPLAIVAHTCHFMLILDMAGFFLQQAYSHNSEPTKAELNSI